VTSHPIEPDSRSDQELVDAANNGDAGAFERLYERYRDWVIGLAWRFTGDREMSLDVMQETFTYVLQLFPGFELRARFTTFLYPVVRHRATAALRKRRRPVPETGLAAEAVETAEGSRRALAEVVASLPSGQREVVILRFAEGLALAEIAAALELPLGTVKSRLHLALKSLRADPRIRKNYLDE
jgi:RNA polymerase sigma-70 factor (ECF subfamily)